LGRVCRDAAPLGISRRGCPFDTNASGGRSAPAGAECALSARVSRIWLAAEGRELVRVVQEKVGLDPHLALVVVGTGQILCWSEEADRFRSAIDWTGEGVDAQPRRLRPAAGIGEVVVDPLHGFGEPVVRNVRTEIIRELYQAGESQDSIAEVYELPRATVEAAVRYELLRAAA
jgi:uncharacterized protein (DUF433 family)